MSSLDVAASPPARAEAGERSPRPGGDWIESVRLALVARVLFFGIAAVASWLLHEQGAGAPDGIVEMWRRWDANHFLTIAEHGYTSPQSDQHAAAFFPGFPLAIRLLGVLGLPPVTAGLLVSAGAATVAGAFLYRLADEEIGPGAGRRALLYLTIFPTTVFLVAPYSEALFLAGAVPAFYFARRGSWRLVGLPAAVAMGARFAGVFLLLGLACEFVRQRRFSPERVEHAVLSLTIGVLPLIAYAAFLSGAMGNPFQFIVHQREGWGRTFVGPVASFLNTWNTWDFDAYPTNWLLAWRLEVLAAAIGVGFTIWALIKREWGYAAFMGSMLVVLMGSTWYYSIPRMLLTMFPIVLFLADATKNRPRVHEGFVIGLAPLAALGVVVFTQGAWFY